MSRSRFARQVRKEIDVPGLRASVLADVNVVVSTTGASSSRSTSRVRQGRAAGTPARTDTDEKETP